MQNFMNPNSVALIGISRRSGPGAFNLMENMVEFGFGGKIYPVNPNSAEILGQRAYPNVRAVKKKIDLAVISAPRDMTINILKDCVAAKIKAAIVVNQGFTDADIWELIRACDWHKYPSNTHIIKEGEEDGVEVAGAGTQ